MARFVALISAAVVASPDPADVERALRRTPGPEFRGHDFASMSSALNGHLRRLSPNFRPCESFAYEELVGVGAAVFRSRDAALAALYAPGDGRAPRFGSRRRGGAAGLAPATADDRAALRDGLCHEVAMWLAHHVGAAARRELLETLALPLLRRPARALARRLRERDAQNDPPCGSCDGLGGRRDGDGVDGFAPMPCDVVGVSAAPVVARYPRAATAALAGDTRSPVAAIPKPGGAYLCTYENLSATLMLGWERDDSVMRYRYSFSSAAQIYLQTAAMRDAGDAGAMVTVSESNTGQRAFDADQDCKKETAPVPALAPDEVCVKVELLSVDAFIRTMLDAEAYHGAIELGDPLPALGYGTVVARAARRSAWASVMGMCKAQTHAVGTMGMEGFMPCMGFPGVPETASLGLLSVATGVASSGASRCSRPVGETALVSAAGGAVGSIAVQLLKTTGARVVGVAGGPKKCAVAGGSAAAVDYKSPTFADDLDAACPDGIDFFLDNAGGDTLRVALDRINMRSRVVVCGAASQYSGNLNTGRDDKGQGGAVVGPSSYLKLSEKSSTMAGFNVMHYFSSIPLALFNLCWYHWRGKVVVHEQIEEGLDAFPGALVKLFSGGHCGKRRPRGPSA
ncbi:prostaglandin reductase [Aureococcus anophagefferens]|nr:prostaglandin reductase [Aureococcus anophagefferens]